MNTTQAGTTATMPQATKQPRRRRPFGAEYQAWREMLRRCYATQNKDYKNYGARGISVCAEWRESFRNFLAYVGEKPEPRSLYSLGRIDNDGNYEPGNVEWQTRDQQENNKRTSRWLQVGSERMTLGQAAKKFKLPKQTLWYRIENGQTPDVAVGSEGGFWNKDRLAIRALLEAGERITETARKMGTTEAKVRTVRARAGMEMPKDNTEKYTGPPRKAALSVKLTVDEKKAFEEVCQRLGLPVSEAIREVLGAWVKVNGGNHGVN